MTVRSEAFQGFIDAADVAFRRFAADDVSRQSVDQAFQALKEPAGQRTLTAGRLPACAVLDDALAVKTEDGDLLNLVEAFRRLEPELQWRRRADPDGTASDNYPDGHANAMVVGPGGVEDRHDVWLGASLLAPHVRYPDHDHTPEEVYLVLSQGEFWHGDGKWFTPGVGGSFYNSPSIRHAMRAGDEPLFAFWVLRTGRA